MSSTPNIASHLLRTRLGKLCVAITGATPEEFVETATAVLKETNFIEFRLDYLPKPAAALPVLKSFLEANSGAANVIATCRCKDNGGRFAGSSAAALDVLVKAAEAGCGLVDIELESIEKLPRNTMEKLRATGAAVIVSWHDFHSTPKDLEPIYQRMLPFAPDFVKIVPTARSLSDNLTLMKFLERAEDRGGPSVVGICMGEQGIISRVLGIRAGSAFTFASTGVGQETAPGQIAARTLIETYRIEQVDAATRVYGVAGDPIGSSLSPLMMNTAFRRETVNSVYLALQTSKAEDLFKLMREIPVQGLSVTMPLKQDVIPFLERVDPLSQKIGAVNTILRAQDGKFYGFNTDVAGILGPLERRLNLRGARVLVVGAGGAARAAVFGCADKGAEVFIVNRTPEPAQKLARQAGAKFLKREQLVKTDFDVIINATPAGMHGNKTAAPLAPEELRARLVFDMVYSPIDTPLLKMARAKGLAVITGVEMFVTQGARQFEIWTGKPAPDQDMLRVVIHALRQGQEGAADTIDPTAPAGRLATAAPAAEAAPQAAAQPAPAAAATKPKAGGKEAEKKPAAPANQPSSATARTAGAAKLPAVKAAPSKDGAARKSAPAKPVKAAAKKPAKTAKNPTKKAAKR